jgi:hypothetical protein
MIVPLRLSNVTGNTGRNTPGSKTAMPLAGQRQHGVYFQKKNLSFCEAL